MVSVGGPNDWALCSYVQEIAHQRDAAMVAKTQLDVAVAALDESARTGGPWTTRDLFAAVQSIVTAAAMISKFLWSGDHDPDERELHAWAKARAARLREVLKVEGGSPLERRAVRNAFEHFDDRLDRILMAGLPVLDYLVVPGTLPDLALRRLDLAAGSIVVLGTREDQVVVDYLELIDCIAAVGVEADRWLYSYAQDHSR